MARIHEFNGANALSKTESLWCYRFYTTGGYPAQDSHSGAPDWWTDSDDRPAEATDYTPCVVHSRGWSSGVHRSGRD